MSHLKIKLLKNSLLRYHKEIIKIDILTENLAPLIGWKLYLAGTKRHNLPQKDTNGKVSIVACGNNTLANTLANELIPNLQIGGGITPSCRPNTVKEPAGITQE